MQGQRLWTERCVARIELFGEEMFLLETEIFPRFGLVDDAEKGCDNCWLCDALNVCLRAATSR